MKISIQFSRTEKILIGLAACLVPGCIWPWMPISKLLLLAIEASLIISIGGAILVMIVGTQGYEKVNNKTEN